MTTKEYLNQIRESRKRVNEKQEQINTMREQLTSVSVKLDGERVSSSSDPDKIGAMVANILEREAELKALLDKYLEKERLISEQIDSMPNYRCREILHWRYVEQKTFEEISANYMFVSFRHAVRLHGRALREFETQYGHLYTKSKDVL